LEVSVLDPGGKPVGSLNGRLQEAAGRGGTIRHWASLRTESGRLETPGLPDEAEVSLTLAFAGTAPLVLRGRPSLLPHLVRLVAGAELSGRLVDRGGAALGGVAVEAEAWASSELPQPFLVKSRSGPDGRWHLRGLPTGKVAWSAQASGFVPIRETFEVEAGARQDVGTRTLEPGSKLAVQVEDDAGAAVPDAQVQAGSGLFVATTDENGIALLTGLAVAPLEIKGSAARHLPASVRFSPPFPRNPQLLLPRAFTVTGRFTDASGSPVLRGSVRLDAGRCQRDERLGPGGRFELDLPPDGAAGELVLRSPETQELRVRLASGHAGEVRDLGDLQALSGLAVTGRVVRSDSNSAVPGARIWTTRQGPAGPAVAWAARDLLEATAGEDGRFRLSGLLPSPAVLRIEAAGLARRQFDLPLDSRETDPNGAAIDLGTIALTAGATLHVRIDAHGKDTQGAVARADLGNQWLEPDLLTAEVWEGEATLPGVPAGRVTVSVVAGRRLLCEQAVLVQDGGEQEVDCRRPSLRVSGRVQIGGALANSGTLVWQVPNAGVQSRIDTVVSPAGLRQYQVVGAGRPQVDVPVGPEGSFETDELVPGPWRVSWISEGSVAGEIDVQIPEVERFETVLPFAGMALTGIVVDREGKPAEGARVRELTSGALGLTPADGSFSLLGLKAGKAVVQAQRQEETSQAVEVQLPGERRPEPLRLVLGEPKAPKVTVLVTDPAGTPMPGAFVFFEEEGKGQRLVTTAADGRTTVSLDPPLAPRVRAAAFGGGTWGFGSWATWEAAQEGITVPLAGAGSLVVHSPRRRGSPHIVTAAGWDLSWMLRLLGTPPSLSAEQPLQLTGLPAGPYSVSLEGASVTVSVEDGKAREGKID